MLPEIKTILYAADLGEMSLPAFLRAAGEAVRHGAQLHVLHVVDASSTSASKLIGSYMADAELQALRADGIRHLKEMLVERIDSFIADQLADNIVLPHRPLPLVEEGRPCETIIRVADAIDADLIVLGTRTRTHTILGRFFVGSTAQSVLQLSDRPLLIVPLSGH